MFTFSSPGAKLHNNLRLMPPPTKGPIEKCMTRIQPVGGKFMCQYPILCPTSASPFPVDAGQGYSRLTSPLLVLVTLIWVTPAPSTDDEGPPSALNIKRATTTVDVEVESTSSSLRRDDWYLWLVLLVHPPKGQPRSWCRPETVVNLLPEDGDDASMLPAPKLTNDDPVSQENNPTENFKLSVLRSR